MWELFFELPGLPNPKQIHELQVPRLAMIINASAAVEELCGLLLKWRSNSCL